MAIAFTLNGQPTSVDVPAEMPLLWLLRDTLGLTGTKFGCGLSECSACAVHVDGVVKRSCSIGVSDVSGSARSRSHT